MIDRIGYDNRKLKVGHIAIDNITKISKSDANWQLEH